MSSTQLLVLGVVRMSAPVLRRSAHVADLAGRRVGQLNPGSIYHALKTLTRDGFLRVVETGRRGSRPERTADELTADGETEFVTLLRESLWTVSSYALPLYAGLAFVTALRCRGAHGAGRVAHRAGGSVRVTYLRRRAALGLVLVAVLGLAMSSASYALALRLKSEDAFAPVQNSIIVPLLLLSGILLPMSLAWLFTVSRFNPFVYVVTSRTSSSPVRTVRWPTTRWC